MGLLVSALALVILVLAICFVAGIWPFGPHEPVGLHTARFAHLHELSPLHLTRGSTKTHLPIGRGEAHSVLGLTPKTDRPELGNVAIFAPTRGGKGLDAVVKILTWQHSLVINDIKGELYEQTAGYRKTLGDVLVLDNMLVAHGRAPFIGPRKVIVSMGDPCSDRGL